MTLPNISPDEIRETYDQMLTISRLVAMVDLPKARAVLESMHLVNSIMPITDPTGWMKLRKTAPAHQTIAAAFIRFRTVLEELRTEEEMES